MQIKSANFIVSNTTYKLCPKANIPEYAFIGRSNVGKSSLINLITNKCLIITIKQLKSPTLKRNQLPTYIIN